MSGKRRKRERGYTRLGKTLLQYLRLLVPPPSPVLQFLQSFLLGVGCYLHTSIPESVSMRAALFFTDQMFCEDVRAQRGIKTEKMSKNASCSSSGSDAPW